MERRGFVKACAVAALATTAPPLPAASAAPRYYGRAQLVDETGQPIRARTLAPQRNFIFHYPYAGTPCFLLNLGRPATDARELRTADARDYHWPGGAGPDRAIVAYSAICAHKLAYPTRDISFISYRAEATPASKYARVIHCCSEHSQYDPARGARVLAGPAPQPLAAILLDYDAKSDALFAIGTLGGEMFNEFFSRFGFRLGFEHAGHAHDAVAGRATVIELARYCRQQVRC